jgi:putative Ca2+/H+ antiporter (TMEM165/GDT1 family)
MRTFVLLISILLPLKISTPPVLISSKFSLVIMHVMGAFVIVGSLMALCPLKNVQDGE